MNKTLFLLCLGQDANVLVGRIKSKHMITIAGVKCCAAVKARGEGAGSWKGAFDPAWAPDVNGFGRERYSENNVVVFWIRAKLSCYKIVNDFVVISSFQVDMKNEREQVRREENRCVCFTLQLCLLNNF